MMHEPMSHAGKNYDFIVVGAGIAGASVAYELSQTATVCLLEAEDRPGLHATGRSAALFAPSYGGREIRALTRASKPFFINPPQGFTESPLLSPRGCLYIARRDQHDGLVKLVEGIRNSGGTMLTVSADEAFTRIPLLKRDYVAEAALDQDAMDIDVNAVHQGFMRGARAKGTVVITNHRVSSARRVQGQWSIQLDDQRAVRAPVLINAAGAWADHVALACGATPVGLQALRRTALLVDPPSDVDIRAWPAVIDSEELFYFKPDAGKLLLSPADETPVSPGDAQPEDLEVATAVDRVEQALNLEIKRVTHSWAGLRTFSPDRAPVLGYDPRVTGFFWCAGQGGYGIQSAPAMARAAASLARHEPLPADIGAEGLKARDLTPARFATSQH
jgi:D-arginine dehydrogenase